MAPDTIEAKVSEREADLQNNVAWEFTSELNEYIENVSKIHE